jgi:regulation of enolase protein 1 (concanavalin A-like superfamily)
MKVDHKTDFYQKTIQGSTADNGHFFYGTLDGDFEVSCRLVGNFVAEYDQMGIMVRLNDHQWIKTGVEVFKEDLKVSAVVTKGLSDWSVTPLNPDQPIWITLNRNSNSFIMQYRQGPEQDWVMIRKTYVDWPSSVAIGLFAASPHGISALNVEWHDISISSRR